ncbi:biotin synthase [Photobacterium aquae]|uniref:Biotin synthase n=1 Tax=Photobacterium aquae TaxID=1195763 RepID=A0A0J1HBB0_9GAMM|nr:type II secretion system F family protein [Photobacterium aquae]KLV08943.1 biotin synthase [Photobacterium aquae]
MLALLSLLLCCILLSALIMIHYNYKRREKTIANLLNKKYSTQFDKINKMLMGFGRRYHKDLKDKMLDAGIYNTQLVRFYFPFKVGVVCICWLMIVFSDYVMMTKMIVALCILIAVIIIPDMYLTARKRALVKKTSRQLPYMLDMMAVCVQTGMTLEAALGFLGEELEAFDRDLCFHIRKTSDSAKVHGLEKALNDFSHRLPTPEVRSFALTLIQNLQHGTSIAMILGDLAEDMRKMQLLTLEEKMGKLSAKISIPLILLIMFPIVIIILAPEVMQLSLGIGQ